VQRRAVSFSGVKDWLRPSCGGCSTGDIYSRGQVSRSAARREADRLLVRSKRTGHTDLACVSDGHEVAARTTTELDDRDEIEAAFTELTAVEREILEMHFYGGLTFREIAEVTETPQGTVATRYRSAMARLRKRMDPVSATPVDAIRETKQ